MATLQGFRDWDDIGICTLGTVIRRMTLKSFQELQTEFHMPHMQFYKYLQFRHTLVPYIKDLKMLAEFNPLKGKLLMGELGDHKITKIYQTLITNSHNSLTDLRETWHIEIGPLEDDDWNEALEPRSTAILSHR